MGVIADLASCRPCACSSDMPAHSQFLDREHFGAGDEIGA